MTNGYALAVLHMQPELFREAKTNRRLFDGVAALISQATANGCPVIFDTLTYSVLDDYAPPHPGLTRLVPGYAMHSHTSMWFAHWTDPAAAFFEVCQRRGYRTDVVKVCGIYLSNCIMSFVRRLAEDADRRAQRLCGLSQRARQR